VLRVDWELLPCDAKRLSTGKAATQLTKYIGLGRHKEDPFRSRPVVMNGGRKAVMESIIETKASTPPAVYPGATR